MPVVFRFKGYRFGFYQADLDEPPHVHVRKADNQAKFWLNPIVLAKSRGFRDHELHEIERILAEHREQVLEAWRNEEAKRGDRTS